MVDLNKKHKEKLAEEKLAQDQLAKEKLAQDQLAKENLAQDKLAKEKLAEEKLAYDQLAKDQIVAESQQFQDSFQPTILLSPNQFNSNLKENENILQELEQKTSEDIQE